MYNRIRTAAREHKPLDPDSRILSIDLGLKNFAYSLLTPAPVLQQDRKAMLREYPLPGDQSIGFDKASLAKKNAANGIGFNKPREKDGIVDAVMAAKNGDGDKGTGFNKPAEKDDAMTDTATFFQKLESTGVDAFKGKDFKPNPEPNLLTDRTYDIRNTTRHIANLHEWRHLNLVPWLETNNEDGRNTEAIGEHFAPNAMADMAYRLVTEHILPKKPSHILIERQRFRTANQAGIFEWTVRVNMLESMIYAILEVMKATGKFDGVIVAVPPKRVVGYLLDKYEHEIPDPGQLHAAKKQVRRPKPTQFRPLDREISPEEEAQDDELLNPYALPLNVDGRDVKHKIKDTKKARMLLLASWFKNQEKIGLCNKEMQRMAQYFVRAVPNTTQYLTLTKQKLRNDAATLPEPKDLPVSLGVGTLLGKRFERTERITKGDHLEKMDDLSDSVTQGIAWMEWKLYLEEAMRTKPWVMENNVEPEKPPLGIPERKRTTGGGL